MKWLKKWYELASGYSPVGGRPGPTDGTARCSGQPASRLEWTVGSEPCSDGCQRVAGHRSGGVPALDFHLTDQFGKPVSLSQFRGKPVVLTFLYTHCPDVCPLIAEQLHRVMLNLGTDAQRVGVLAVSVEPKRDTVAFALVFSQAHHRTTFWHFLVGTQAQLAPVWTAYAIGALQVSATVSKHTTALYVIDQHRRECTLLDQTFLPTYQTGLLQTLLKE